MQFLQFSERGLLCGSVILWEKSYKSVRKLTHYQFYIKYNSPYAYVGVGYLFQYKPCTQGSTHDDLPNDVDDGDTKASRAVFAT